MTHAKSADSSGSVPPSDGKQRKAVLYCPCCRHDSPIDGDWELVVHREYIVLHCPTCRTELTNRPL
ncbi:MAG: hypothetical protein ACI8XM_000611 [Haloarculaceae archaeon]|jgi:hypothetical protein